jgi:WhiB family redox-sensing transcriptional regulator
MCRPGTSAVAVGTAGLEAETTSAQVSSPRLPPGMAPGSGNQGLATAAAAVVPGTLARAGHAGRQARLARRGAARVMPPSRPELPCRDDPELFFAESPQDVEFAKALCGACPVRAPCLAGAMERREPWGVWGGELFERGQVVPRKRPRGRPRKAEVAA